MSLGIIFIKCASKCKAGEIRLIFFLIRGALEDKRKGKSLTSLMMFKCLERKVYLREVKLFAFRSLNLGPDTRGGGALSF